MICMQLIVQIAFWDGAFVAAFHSCMPSWKVPSFTTSERENIAFSSCRRRLSNHPTTRLYDSEKAPTKPAGAAKRALEKRVAPNFTGAALETIQLIRSNNTIHANGHAGSKEATSPALPQLVGKDDAASIVAALEEIEVPMPTAKGGFTHTKASKAKISAGNKGKNPWNKGKTRSEEAKARISAGVRARNRKKLLAKIAKMGLTEEEYWAQKEEEKRRKAEARRLAKLNKTRSEETRLKISRALKARFALKPRVRNPATIRRGFHHSEATRAKISETLRNRWKDDSFRASMMNFTVRGTNSTTIRQRISETLKKRWTEPEFRKAMMEKIRTRRSSHRSDNLYRKKVSASIKAKWQDPEYREKVLAKIRERSEMARRNRPFKPPRGKTKAQIKREAFEAAGLDPNQLPKKRLKNKPEIVKLTPIKPTKVRQIMRALQPKDQEQKPKPPEEEEEEEEEEENFFDIDFEESDDSDDILIDRAMRRITPSRTSKRKTNGTRAEVGNVKQLREDRRDLYDYLYGDEHAENVPGGGDDDDDLADYDPYGLDNR